MFVAADAEQGGGIKTVFGGGEFEQFGYDRHGSENKRGVLKVAKRRDGGE